MSSATKTAKKNNFPLWITLTSVFLLVGIGLTVYLVGGKEKQQQPTYSYLNIPTSTTVIGDRSVSMQITVQVADEDRAWADEHKSEIEADFKAEMFALDSKDLDDSAGLVKLQEKFRQQINARLATDLVKAVWITSVLHGQVSFAG